MTRDELKSMVRELYFYFRFKDPADPDQIDGWLKSLSYVDSGAIEFIKENIKESESLPRNLPKTIKGIYARYCREKKVTSNQEYDEYDDPRYPIAYLHRATELYISVGKKAFDYYVKENNMPSQDIERVENKVKMIFSDDKIEKFIGGIGGK